MNFKDLGIIDPILKALEEEGYESPSPIQEQSIPHLIEGKDLLGCAQTGTGKTAAFAIPILQRLSLEKKPAGRPIRALILTPTRELALQIQESFSTYGRHLGLRATAIYGGVPQRAQTDRLRQGMDIVVATPGRLMDLHKQGFIDYKHLEVFVLDEADRMLDMGFVVDVKKILTNLPEERQNLLFSATMPKEVKALVDTILKDYETITITPENPTVDAIDQRLYYVDRENKQKLLFDILIDEKIESALVFTRTKHGADRVVKELLLAGVSALSIHGNKSQGARQLALRSFKNRRIRVLVATDIAARGIDIDELAYVFNFDLPESAETYVHRIGRTGRAGLSGSSVSFCMIDEYGFLRDIERLIGKKIPVIDEHKYPLMNKIPTPKEPRKPRARVSTAPVAMVIQKKKDHGSIGSRFSGSKNPAAAGGFAGNFKKRKKPTTNKKPTMGK